MTRKYRLNKFLNGFTIMEIMIVLIILSAMAALSFPRYISNLNNSRARDALIQLSTIHATNEIYEANAGQYLSDGGGTLGVSAINTGLGINIIPGKMTYTYEESSGNYNAYADWSGSGAFVITVNEGDLGAGNPCCFCGTCPSSVENNCATMCP